MKKIEEIFKNTEIIKKEILKLNFEVPPLGGGTNLAIDEEKLKKTENEKTNKDETHPKINLRLKKNIKEKLDDLAAEHGMHTATYVRTLCYMAIASELNLNLNNLDMKSELKKLEAKFI